MTRQTLAGVHAVVTGATSGLGLAMARALLEEGAVLAIAARDTPRLGETVERLRGDGLAAEPLPLDVRDPDSAARAAEHIDGEWPRLDLVVNNAGIGMRTVNPRFLTEPRPFWEVSPEGWRDLIDTNLTGYFLVARAFAPLFVRRGGGRFVNVTMNHSTMRRRGFVPYGPSRAGAESLSHIMCENLREHGIAVNMLAPGGATVTGMIPDDFPEERRGALLQPEVMGPPIVWLASGAAEGVTGERIIATEWDAWLAERERFAG